MAPKPGTDPDQFVHPERISSQLICPICTLVLENPVQTPTDHLFCEDELLEWMSRSTMCPATNTPLDPETIRKPSRIILNMLAELQRYCPNRSEGCDWIGENEHCASHAQNCKFRPRAQLISELSKAEERIARLKEKLTRSEKNVEFLTAANAELTSMNVINERKLRCYNAFLEPNNRGTPEPIQSSIHSHRSEHKNDQRESDYKEDKLLLITTDLDPHSILSSNFMAMTPQEKAAHETSVMAKLNKLRSLHGSLADVAVDRNIARR